MHCCVSFKIKGFDKTRYFVKHLQQNSRNCKPKDKWNFCYTCSNFITVISVLIGALLTLDIKSTQKYSQVSNYTYFSSID